MPESFPVADPTTGTLTPTPHYSVDEVAAMIHVHPSTVHRLMRRDRWPHLAIANRIWFAEADVLAALAHMRRNDEPDLPPPPPGRLGLALPPDDPDEGADDGSV
jgi:hypothetical protein